MNGIAKATPADAGCYIVGHWGQYAVARMIELATELGYDDAQAIELAARHLASMGSESWGETVGLTDNEHELLTAISDEAEQWLNDNVAPEGYAFGWYDGEFFLQSLDWWEEA